MPLPNIWHCEGQTRDGESSVSRTMELSGRYIDHLELQEQPELLNTRTSHYQVFLKAIEGPLVGKATEISEPLKSHNFHIRLFHLNIPANGTLTGRVLCKGTENSKMIDKAGLWYTYRDSNNNSWNLETDVPDDEIAKHYDIPLKVSHPTNANSGYGCLVEVGVFCFGPANAPATPLTPVLDLYSFTIIPRVEDERTATISNIRVCQRRSGINCDKRLAWDWTAPREKWSANMPWCRNTGPFERFDIEICGRAVGEVCCDEFPLQEEDFDELEDGDEVLVIIRGMLFGGGLVMQSETIAKPYFI